MLQRGLYGPIPDQQSELLDTILVSARQLLFFINNLLDQAQLEAGKVTLSKVEFTPADLLTDVQIAMLPLAIRKELKLETEMSDDLPPSLCGDPQRLNQIVSNLVVNAIKFTDQGMVKVRLCRPDQTHWAIQVSDTGPGIPPEAQGRIFEAFWQVDGSATRKVSRGVGLGLSIVQQLTALMEGQVSVRSEFGSGSTFTVTLPIEAAQGEYVNGQAVRINS
jgi:signal transduction histidine kinase